MLQGYCYVNYSTPAAASSAIQQFNGIEFPPGGGQKMKVLPAEPLGVKAAGDSMANNPSANNNHNHHRAASEHPYDLPFFPPYDEFPALGSDPAAWEAACPYYPFPAAAPCGRDPNNAAHHAGQAHSPALDEQMRGYPGPYAASPPLPSHLNHAMAQMAAAKPFTPFPAPTDEGAPLAASEALLPDDPMHCTVPSNAMEQDHLTEGLAASVALDFASGLPAYPPTPSMCSKRHTMHSDGDSSNDALVGALTDMYLRRFSLCDSPRRDTPTPNFSQGLQFSKSMLEGPGVQSAFRRWTTFDTPIDEGGAPSVHGRRVRNSETDLQSRGNGADNLTAGPPLGTSHALAPGLALADDRPASSGVAAGGLFAGVAKQRSSLQEALESLDMPHARASLDGATPYQR